VVVQQHTVSIHVTWLNILQISSKNLSGSAGCVSFPLYYNQNHLHGLSLHFAFVQEQQNVFASMQQGLSMKRERIMRGHFRALVWNTKYNYWLKNACLEMYTTPIMESWNWSDFFRLCGNNDLEMCLHVLYGVCTHGTPISNRLFWMSCLPSMVMQSWMHNSIRQPAWAHCGVRRRETSVSYCGRQTFACVSHEDWGN